MTVTLQMQLEHAGDFYPDELDSIQDAMNYTVIKLEKLSYTRYQMYVDGLDYNCWKQDHC